jgi:hypothetical protein
MAHEGDNFLNRWARRKRESANAVAATAPGPAQPLPALPPIDGLSFDSDFEAFMHAKVDERVRRMALKKLFSDPRFNVMDGLDVYIDDYSKDDPIPPGMLAQLQHARTTLFGPQTEKEREPEDDPQLAKAPPAADPVDAEPDHGAAGQDA